MSILDFNLDPRRPTFESDTWCTLTGFQCWYPFWHHSKSEYRTCLEFSDAINNWDNSPRGVLLRAFCSRYLIEYYNTISSIRI